jgi:hypothetical protein
MTTITMNEIIHAAVRRDLARTEAALRSFPDGDRSRAEAIKRAWDFLTQTLHDHHVGEDAHVWPYLRSLGGVDPALADQMEAFVASADAGSAETAADSVATAAGVTTRHSPARCRLRSVSCSGG